MFIYFPAVIFISMSEFSTIHFRDISMRRIVTAIFFCLSVMTLLCECGDNVCVWFCYHASGSFMFGSRWFLFSFCCTIHLCLCAYWPPFPKLHNCTVLVPIYDKMPEDMLDRMQEDLSVTKPINVMVGITRSKVIFAVCYVCSCSSDIHAMTVSCQISSIHMTET